ncbi:MAG: deoxyguanosinetriphosphate triphosphohydrolase, partial [Rhodospirillaceae bacterium]|nr:deoxyguanosinetriphosphate triphosphohydrolase [Rhodospirillaceae bacterium]
AAEVRALDHPVIAFSEAMAANDRTLKEFLYRRMYRHYKVNRMASKARRVVRELFQLFIVEPECLPDDWRERCNGVRSVETARAVADYIAGMTDRFAFLEYQRLFDVPS